MRRTVLAGVFALLSTAGVLVGAQPAMAANCSGSLIAHVPAKSANGTIQGYLDVYYNSSTGMNCARTNSVSHNWGQRKWMTVYLARCAQTRPGPTCTSQAYVSQAGDYEQYAGPKSIAARGHCIVATARIYPYSDSRTAFAKTSPEASHCG